MASMGASPKATSLSNFFSSLGGGFFDEGG